MSDEDKRWCPNCALREKADPAMWDGNGGEFWWCVAQPIVPEFSGVTIRHGTSERYGPVNLRLFDEGTTYHDGLTRRSCPLFVAR